MIRIILKENTSNTLDKNVEFLLRSKFGLYKKLDNSIKSNLSEIEMLSHSLIVKELGSGFFGTAFLLNNGLVLKIYVKSPQDDPDLLAKLAFKGKGSKSLPFYHDFGVFKKTRNDDYEAMVGLGYYVMPRLTTAKDHIEHILRKVDIEQEEDDLAYVLRAFGIFVNNSGLEPFDTLFSYMIEKYGSNSDKFSKTFKIAKTLKWLGPEELKKACKAVYDLKMAHPEAYDFHAGNIGIDQHGNWIMFDY